MLASNAVHEGAAASSSTSPSDLGESRGARAILRRAIAPVEWISLGLLLTLFIWKGLLPAWQELNTDFPNYYLAGRLFRGGYALDRAYDWVWFQRQKDHAGIDRGVVGFAPLSPFSALVVAPLASLSPLAAKRCWLCVNIVLLAATIFVLRRMTRLSARRIAIVTFLAVIPLRTCFQFGQQLLLILFLMGLAGWLYLREREVASGTVLAVASVLKLYPALFALFFLVKHRWRALGGLCASFTALVVLGTALFGRETLRVYAACVLPRMLVGESVDPYHSSANSTTELLRQLFVAHPELNPHPLVNAPAAYFILQPLIPAVFLLSALWLMTSRPRPHARDALHWGAFVALLLVLSPGSASYHYCALILATALGVDFLLRQGCAKEALFLVGLHALVCAPLYRFAPDSPSGWLILLGAPRLYALLAYWGLLYWTLWKFGGRQEKPGRSTRTAAALGLAFVLLAVFGIISSRRHLDGRVESSAASLPVAAGVSYASAPSVGPRGVYFSRRLSDEGYTLDLTGVGLLTRTPKRTDLFHPAVAPGLGEGWVEVSSRTSCIARFQLDARVIVSDELPVEIDDAEQPAVSADGRWLAFLREERGRGSLWVAERRPHGQGGVQPVGERQVVDATHDVLDFAFFPDNRIIMAARSGAEAGLFVTSAASGSLVEFSTSSRRARYPAISGRPMARL